MCLDKSCRATTPVFTCSSLSSCTLCPTHPVAACQGLDSICAVFLYCREIPLPAPFVQQCLDPALQPNELFKVEVRINKGHVPLLPVMFEQKQQQLQEQEGGQREQQGHVEEGQQQQEEGCPEQQQPQEEDKQQQHQQQLQGQQNQQQRELNAVLSQLVTVHSFNGYAVCRPRVGGGGSWVLGRLDRQLDYFMGWSVRQISLVSWVKQGLKTYENRNNITFEGVVLTVSAQKHYL